MVVDVVDAAGNEDAEATVVGTEKYLVKGTKIYVEGKLKKRSWQDKEGLTRYSTEVVGDEMTILSKIENKENNAAPYRQESNKEVVQKIQDFSPEEGDVLPLVATFCPIEVGADLDSAIAKIGTVARITTAARKLCFVTNPPEIISIRLK